MCIYYLTQAWIQPNYLLLSAPEESQTITHVASFISDAVSMINERRKKKKIVDRSSGRRYKLYAHT